MLLPLFACLGLSVGIQWVLWVVAALLHTEKFYDLAGIWIFVTLLPSLMLNLEKRDKPLGLRDFLGWSLWTVGFITQATADQQKWSFRSDPDNMGTFIQSGLWAYSRHPNYLGEILQWSGLFLSASTVLSGFQLVSIISPVFVWFLLSYVSGIPILERQALKRWGSEAAYQSYVQRTPVLWPFKF
ncbi:hypothetical protein XENTR_v10006867 [Xenopus tropicalis]|nr:hypothetical protein XENTR_v10006867 [Xenopus tropicalis]